MNYRSPETDVGRLNLRIGRLRSALADSLDGHYATWMAARAEVEGAATARALFEKEPEVIAARKALDDEQSKDATK